MSVGAALASFVLLFLGTRCLQSPDATANANESSQFSLLNPRTSEAVPIAEAVAPVRDSHPINMPVTEAAGRTREKMQPRLRRTLAPGLMIKSGSVPANDPRLPKRYNARGQAKLG